MTEDQFKALEKRLAAIEAKLDKLPAELPKQRPFIMAIAKGLHDARRR